MENDRRRLREKRDTLTRIRRLIGLRNWTELQRLLKHTDADIRAAAAGALGSARRDGKQPRVVEALLPLLHPDQEQAVREAAVRSLGHLGDPSAAEALFPLIGEDQPDIQKAAAQALGNLGSEEAVDVLMDVLHDIHTEDLKKVAIRSLGRIGDTRAVEALLTLLYTADLRGAAIRSLGEIGDTRAVEALLTLLPLDEAYEIRLGAVHALGQIGDERATKALARLLKPTPPAPPRVRFPSLQKKRQEKKRAEWRRARDMQLEVARALRLIGGTRALEALRPYLNQEYHPEVRNEAALALGRNNLAFGAATVLVKLSGGTLHLPRRELSRVIEKKYAVSASKRRGILEKRNCFSAQEVLQFASWLEETKADPAADPDYFAFDHLLGLFTKTLDNRTSRSLSGREYIIMDALKGTSYRVYCQRCAQVYEPAEIRHSNWGSARGLAGGGGEKFTCPHQHELFSVQTWIA